MTYRVLVCGSRTWDDAVLVRTVLNGLAWEHADLEIIEGGASGPDHMAAEWASGSDRVECHRTFLAAWRTYGKSAGPVRNQQMLDEGMPDLVVAFSEHPITRGTADMVVRAEKAKVPVWVVSHG